ncbi:MAG: hypothetical protein ACM33T_16860 [Solirubrobacterales bacterium]
MKSRATTLLVSILALAACTLPASDQPAHYSRMGRFMGLVARCGCSDITPSRMVAEYPRALGSRYSAADIERMHGYVAAGATEKFDNEIEICAEACSQRCMVNAVAGPLGGRTVPGVPACLVNERDLHLTEGRWFGDNQAMQ